MAKRKSKAPVFKIEATKVAGTTMPMPPDYLATEGERMWYRICLKLSEMELLTDSAFPQIADYCFNWQVFCFNAGVVKGSETPGVEEYSTGSRGLSANYKAATEARKSMVTFERYWGLNPMSLSKIVLPKTGGDDEDDEFGL